MLLLPPPPTHTTHGMARTISVCFCFLREIPSPDWYFQLNESQKQDILTIINFCENEGKNPETILITELNLNPSNARQFLLWYDQQRQVSIFIIL